MKSVRVVKSDYSLTTWLPDMPKDLQDVAHIYEADQLEAELKKRGYQLKEIEWSEMSRLRNQWLGIK